MIRTGIALAVAAIPEGLPVVVTSALVRAMHRMRREGIVVRRASAVETLGGVTVVCADKTGTLTRNDMELDRLELADGPADLDRLRADRDVLPEDPAALALAAAVLNSEVEVHHAVGGVDLVGSSTERAFVRAAQASGMDVERLRRGHPRRELLERREDVPYVVTHHGGTQGSTLVFVKGAPEQVLALCSRIPSGPLAPAERARILARNAELAQAGLRVLAIAWRSVPRGAAPEAADLTFLALAGLRDPLRPSAREAVRVSGGAGVRTVVVTGDQRATAVAVARAVGLEGEAHDGRELERILATGPRAAAVLERTSVLARVSPAQKVGVVTAFRELGHVVGMVGDGVNDAAALKAADVGIAVGPGSSDVARQTADVVLATEDLPSILRAVGEGRIVQDNLRRATRYLFATNLSEVALVVAGAVLGAEALTPIQLLWVNILTDTLPALAIAFEPGDADVLDRPPAPPDAPIIRGDEWPPLVRDGLLLAALGGAALALGGPPLAFAVLPAAQLTYAVRCRAPGRRRNALFPALVGGGAALHGAAMVVPQLRRVLGALAPSPASLLAFATGLATPLVAALLEREEIVVTRSPRRPAPADGAAA